MSLKPGAASPCRVTVAIAATDQHEALASTLATARLLADEILLIDASGAAKSVGAADAKQLVIIQQTWEHDHAALRNAALRRATGDWLIWLEPGEAMSAEAAASLRSFVQDKADPGCVYMLVIAAPPAPGDISGEQVAQIRLTPRDARLNYQGRVREQLDPSPQTLNLAIEGLPWRIRRTVRQDDPRIKARQSRQRLELIDRDLAERGPLASLLVARGEALIGLGDMADAAKTFRQAIAVAAPQSFLQREAYYGLLTSYVSPADRAQQVAVCVEALERFPLDAQLLCAMGGYMQAEGRLDLSAQAYRTAADHGQIDPEAWHVPDIHEIAAICLSLTFQLRGRDDEARQVLEQMLARRPEAHRVRRHLLEQHIRHDRRAEALAEFDRLPADLPHREALRSAIRGACLAAKRNWVPAAAYLQTAYAAGCRDVLCLRWLALTLAATGQNEAALPVLDDWLAAEPRSADALKQRTLLEAAMAAAPAKDARIHRPSGTFPPAPIMPTVSLAATESGRSRPGTPV